MRNSTRYCTIRLFLAGATMAALTLAADSSSVNSPVMGYVVRPLLVEVKGGAPRTPELRAMLGVPGAARFSDPLQLPSGTVSLEMAPGLGWMLLIRAGGLAVYQPGTQTETPLPSGLPASVLPKSWAFSPTGSRLALFYPDLAEVVLLSGLPASPVLESTVKVALFDSFAAGDNGGFIYTSANQVFTGGGQLLYQSQGSLGPVAYEAGRDAIALFDGSNSSLEEVVLAGAVARVISTGIPACDQLFAAADKIYLTAASSGTVSIVDYADGSIISLKVAASARLIPSAVAGTMLVSFEAREPAWLVNAQGVSFVPAAIAAQTAVTQ
jgi:hypothetical protein